MLRSVFFRGDNSPTYFVAFHLIAPFCSKILSDRRRDRENRVRRPSRTLRIKLGWFFLAHALRVAFSGGIPLFRRGNHAKLTREMTSPNKTERKSLDDILRDQARRLTQRVLTDQRHLEEIGRKVKAIKMIVRKHAKRHR